MSPPIGTIPRCLIATIRGGERLLKLAETDSHGKRTETVLLGPTPIIVTVHYGCMQHTPDEFPGLRSRSRPQGLKVSL